ncbi:hypothetical protein AADF95_004512 [Vibrio alginolyticus]
MANVALYRGTSSAQELGVRDNIYLTTPRRPRNSSQILHQIADNWFESKFGIKARSQTIFCTPDFYNAQRYVQGQGQVVKVTVPEGLDFTLIYSPNVSDFNEIECHVNNTEDQNEVHKWLDSQSYCILKNSYELPEDFSGEVMLYCSQFETSL